MEQIEDGAEDHNVVAVPVGEAAEITVEVEARLTDFVSHVFDHVEGKRIIVGRFLGRSEAEAHIRKCLDVA
jgi:inorganic pyrophosphatase